eukprot:CAMPEP_0175164074 /NCGR_PEP_ID=MMETSP0087-20121206/26170_1 /TAXON_ID=136419 /ORGANISM="Unknown Unknown, Strain D1" /LENGTH=291 /DNA_ID=CAMNT_0016452983 /DNA_START=41 /DNA_END=912 /DNA_ORIENTATION=-
MDRAESRLRPPQEFDLSTWDMPDHYQPEFRLGTGSRSRADSRRAAKTGAGNKTSSSKVSFSKKAETPQDNCASSSSLRPGSYEQQTAASRGKQVKLKQVAKAPGSKGLPPNSSKRPSPKFPANNILPKSEKSAMCEKSGSEKREKSEAEQVEDVLKKVQEALDEPGEALVNVDESEKQLMARAQDLYKDMQKLNQAKLRAFTALQERQVEKAKEKLLDEKEALLQSALADRLMELAQEKETKIHACSVFQAELRQKIAELQKIHDGLDSAVGAIEEEHNRCVALLQQDYKT